VRVTVFLSFVPFTTPEPRIKGSRANNLQVGIKPTSAIEPAAWRTNLSTAVSLAAYDSAILVRVMGIILRSLAVEIVLTTLAVVTGPRPALEFALNV